MAVRSADHGSVGGGGEADGGGGGGNEAQSTGDNCGGMTMLSD